MAPAFRTISTCSTASAVLRAGANAGVFSYNRVDRLKKVSGWVSKGFLARHAEYPDLLSISAGAGASERSIHEPDSAPERADGSALHPRRKLVPGE